ncbi:hypothetical protein D3C87_1705840 [compost metagenome]
MVSQLNQSLRQEFLDRLASIRQNLAVRGEAAGLEREYKAVRHFRSPFGKGLRFLRTVIGAVDLDHRELARGIFQLPFLSELFGVECALPRLEGPAADTAADRTTLAHLPS